MQLKTLRNLLPNVEIEDDSYCIGYWLRWAGQDRAKGWNRWVKEGYDQAENEIAYERQHGSIIVGASLRINDRPNKKNK